MSDFITDLIFSESCEHSFPHNYNRYNNALAELDSQRIADLDKQGKSSWEISQTLRIKQTEVKRRRHLVKCAALKDFRESLVKEEPPQPKEQPTRSLPVDISAIQRRMIEQFHEVSIRIDKKLATTFGVFPRHTRGGVLNPLALKLLPKKFSSAFHQVLKNKDVRLVHLNGIVMTVPNDIIKITK